MEDSMISNFNNSGGANIQQSTGSSMGSGMADGELNVTGSQSTSNQKQTVQYTIPGILCFIQNEWTKFEMERSQWEIDKAELQVLFFNEIAFFLVVVFDSNFLSLKNKPNFIFIFSICIKYQPLQEVLILFPPPFFNFS